MKENPSSPMVCERNPYVISVDKVRKVIRLNFKANRAEADLRARYGGSTLYEALRKPEACLAFLEKIMDFEMNDPSYLTELVLAAVGTGGSRALFFVQNFKCFALMMESEGLGDALCTSVKAEGQAARYFLVNQDAFSHLLCFARAKKFAEHKDPGAKNER